MMNTRKRPLAGLLCLALFMSACGGPTDTALSEASAASNQESTAELDQSSGSDDVTRFPGHEGIPLTSGFIPELADLPVPDVAAFHIGGAYDASQDPRETAVQQLDFLLEPDEVAVFYLEQLLAQGYTVANGSQADSAEEIAEFAEDGFQSFLLVFDGPDGVPLQLNISPGNTGGNTTMNINRFRSGSR